MGMFDQVYVSSEFLQERDIFCPYCKNSFANVKFQTKDFENVMQDYYLTSGMLYVLDGPSKKYWHEYTKQELEDINNDMSSTWLPILGRKQGDGYYTEEGWLPANRKKQSMGELPHAWVQVYHLCDCRKCWINIDIKFTDGVVQDVIVNTENYTVCA